MHARIAFVKTGWSDHYEGDPVLGRHAHVQEYDEAHERFNFLQHTDRRYYGYLPPIGKKERPPQPKQKENWLLVFVAARNGNGPLTVVGWYEHAILHEEYIDRPEYSVPEDFELDVHGKKYKYCLSANNAHLIPPIRTTCYEEFCWASMDSWRLYHLATASHANGSILNALRTSSAVINATFAFPKALHIMISRH